MCCAGGGYKITRKTEPAMRLIFAGTPPVAVPILEALAASRHEVCAVLTQPDRPKGRGRKPAPSPVKEFATQHNIKVLSPEKINNREFWAVFDAIAPDAAVLAFYGGIIGRHLLASPKHGWLNVHPSLLPAYRGPSPVPTTILNGETKTGVTIIRLDTEMDHGPILKQIESPIGENETADELLMRMARRGADEMIAALDLVESGEANFVEQDHSAATFTKIFAKSDGAIAWNEVRLHDFVRAMNPWPGAATKLRVGATGALVDLTILRTEAPECPPNAEAEPGTVVAVSPEGLVVRDARGCVLITGVKAAGKKESPAHDFANGYRVRPGDKFE